MPTENIENIPSLNSISFFTDHILVVFYKLTNIISILEIGIGIGIVFLSYLLYKWLKLGYENYFNSQENVLVHQKIRQFVLPFLAPAITFVMLSIVMTFFGNFTHHLEIYKISINLTLIWCVWILIQHAITDLLLRYILIGTVIPLLIFTAFGLANPLITYLDSLSFSIGDVRISIFILLKGLLICACLTRGTQFISKYAISLIENQKKINPEVQDLVQNIFQAILYTAVVLITIDLLGIDLKSLAIIGGAIGIGIGLGLQKIAANFISGLILLVEQNVKVGHLVEVPGGGRPGWIRHLGARAAVIDTGDGKSVLIPNEELLTKTVIDWTSKDRKTRIELLIKVNFESNLEKAKEIMLEATVNHPICSKSIKPSCFLQKFTDIGAQFLLQFWVDDLTVGSMDIQNDVLLTIWKRFSEEGIKLSNAIIEK